MTVSRMSFSVSPTNGEPSWARVDIRRSAVTHPDPRGLLLTVLSRALHDRSAPAQNPNIVCFGYFRQAALSRK